MIAMRFANGEQWFRMGLAVVFVGLVAGPVFALGAMGGFGPGFGGFHRGVHGGFHGAVGRAPPPPAIDAPTPKPPFTNPPPPMRMHDHGRDHVSHNHFHDRFHNRFRNGLAWGWGGGWGGGYNVYATSNPADAEPVDVAEREARPPEPPPCPVLLTWSPKLGHATRQRLCETN